MQNYHRGAKRRQPRPGNSSRTANGEGTGPTYVTVKLHVTAQTAYHIKEIALREGIPDGKVVDKLMRTYLASRNYERLSPIED